MAAFRCLLLASVAAVGDALQQPAQAGRDTEGAFRAVSSKMDELHAGLAKVKAESLNAVSKEKAELDSKLEELLMRNRDVENINAGLAEDSKNLVQRNFDLRKQSTELAEECQDITAELKVMQSNITMAQEFIARSIGSSNVSLHGSPELQVLADLDAKDAIDAREQHHEKRLKDLGGLVDKNVVMFQLGAREKSPGTKDLLQDLLSSWSSISGQQDTSLKSLKEAFDKEHDKCDKQYKSLLQEQTELNATKQSEEALNAKLQGAVDHLKVSREHLLQEKVALQKFAWRLGGRSVQGDVAPAPTSLSLPHSSNAAVALVSEEKPVAVHLQAAATWLKSTLR